MKNLLITLVSFSVFAGTINMSLWQEQLSEDGIKVFSKKNHKGPVIPLMAQGQLNHSMDLLLSVLGDGDRRQEWIPRQKIGRTLKKMNHFDRIEYSVTNVPWPFNDREFVYRAKTEIVKKEKKVIIHMHSQPWQKFKNSYVRGEMHDGTMILRQLKPNVIEFTMKFESDPKGMIPNWIINIAQKKWPLKFIQNLRIQLQKVEKEGSYTYKGIDIFNLTPQQMKLGLKKM